MKKLFLLMILITLFSPVFVLAQDCNYKNDYITYSLRAGGGSSSGGGSSGGGGSGGRTHGPHGRNSSNNSNPITTVINVILIMALSCMSSIVLYVKVVRSSINSKRYLKILGKKDITWQYKNIEKQAIKTFYSVQKSWTNMDMKPSQEYMSKDLYEAFNIKLNFMEMQNKRNILKMINLFDIKPVGVYDDKDDDKDIIWFYIKGYMIDYIINTNTNEKIEGSEHPKSFIEFWKFKRNEKGNWVLDKIKQKDEINTIIFQQNK